MKVDAGGYPSTIDQAGRDARHAEEAGCDGWWAPETQIDPFLASSVAAERTHRLQVGTGIAVALARNPMTVAVQANDLQLLSHGRFVLGLGSQIRPHITNRFSMPWTKPAARMREFVLAVRAIWLTWATGARLDFRGEFYTHTLTSPFFDPGPNPHGNPRVMLAGVGARMTEVAGEIADGLICHVFSTERYVREVTIPAVERGRAKAGRTLEDFEISVCPFLVMHDTDADVATDIRTVKEQIAFYGSTPAYRAVLDLYGWGGLHEELNELTRRGRWDRLADAVDDEVLRTFAIIGTPEEAVREIRRRYEGIATRITVTPPPRLEGDRWKAIVDAIRSA